VSDKYHDGEVVGLDKDGNVICWDDTKGQHYNTGGSLEDLGTDSLTNKERKRLGLPADQPEALYVIFVIDKEGNGGFVTRDSRHGDVLATTNQVARFSWEEVADRMANILWREPRAVNIQRAT
jgi:hypothetical protein